MIYIYTLTNDKDTNDIRYIGKTTNLKNRLRKHLSNYSLKIDTYKNNWIKKELLLGNKILIHSIEEVNENNWQEREIYWIKKYKDLGYNLTNTTLGGDGLILEKNIIEKRNSTRIKNNLETKKEEIELFKIKEIDGKWIGERVCPKCDKIVIHNSKDFNKIISLLKKSTNRNCISCASKEKTPFTNHTWSNKGKKYTNTINPTIIREKYGKKFYQYDLDNNLIDEFVSIRDAANKTKIDRKSISHCLRGIRKTAGGYIFIEKET